MPVSLLNTNHYKMHPRKIIQISFHRTAERGSVNANLPLILAFSIFSLFLLMSFWFLSQNKKRAPVLLQQPTAPISQQKQTTNPFEQHTAKNIETFQDPQQSPFGKTPPKPPSLTAPTKQSFTEDLAVNLVTQWLNFKTKLYTEPFDSTNLDQYIVRPGKLYEDITKPGGSIDWLKQKDSYYKFNKIQIKKVQGFQLYQNKAHITVDILEDMELITPSGVDPTQSGIKQQTWTYDLEMNKSGKWRIYDYRKKT